MTLLFGAILLIGGWWRVIDLLGMGRVRAAFGMAFCCLVPVGVAAIVDLGIMRGTLLWMAAIGAMVLHSYVGNPETSRLGPKGFFRALIHGDQDLNDGRGD